MSFNGSGSYSLAAGNPVTTGTTISSTWANNTFSDLATALSTAVCKDGQQTITANITMSGFKLTNLAAATAVADAPRASQVQNSSFTHLTSPAGTNTITASATPTPAAYAVGQKFTFIPANTNTGAATLNISSLGAGAVQWAGAALTGGELVSGTPVEVVVTATTPVFEIVAPTQFADTRALVVGGTDATKKLRFEVDGLTTATTRVATMPDADITLVGTAATQTLTNKTLTSPVLDTGVSGTAVATQAAMETGTSTSLIVTPGRQHYHPAMPKAIVVFDGSGTPSIKYSYNVTSITDNGTGDYTINLTNALSDTNVGVVITCSGVSGGNAPVGYVKSDTLPTASAVRIQTLQPGTGLQDPNWVSVVIYGDI